MRSTLHPWPTSTVKCPWVGLTEDQAKAQSLTVKKGRFPWSVPGRAITNGRDEGVTKLLLDNSP